MSAVRVQVLRKMSNKLLQLLLLLLAIAVAREANAARPLNSGQRLRLPSGYNMRLGPLPNRFLGKGAYTLASKRTPPNLANNAKPGRLKQQQQAQKRQQQPQVAHWSRATNKKQY